MLFNNNIFVIVCQDSLIPLQILHPTLNPIFSYVLGHGVQHVNYMQ